MKFCIPLMAVWLFFISLIKAQSTFINEINYAASNPVNAGVEIAGDAGLNLANWKVITYDLTGVQLDLENLTGVISNQQNGHGTIWYDVEQNSNGGGVALFNPSGIVVLFLSYGPANPGLPDVDGVSAIYIGEQSSESNYLQLQGTGNTYPDFTWNTPGGNTEGAINTGQNFSALPIELTNFSAKPTPQGVLLHWTTASEVNNQQFLIERSIDGRRFEALHQIEGAGNSLTELHYQFLDKEPPDGLVYYRLRQVDFDGNFSLSHTLHVKIEQTGFGIVSALNPVTDKLLIWTKEGFEADGTIQIYDLTGQLFLEKEQQIGGKIIELDVANLPAGKYIFQIASRHLIHSELIIKQ